MSDRISLNELNTCDRTRFVELLGGIFEHSPWFAEQAFEQRPFDSREQLHQALFDAVLNSSREVRVALIRSHPELAGKEAEAGTLTDESNTEQRGAGLDQCSTGELEQLRDYNRRYRERFGFPIVIAVKGLDRHRILSLMESRLNNTPEQELDACIGQIGRIAGFRLNDLISDDA